MEGTSEIKSPINPQRNTFITPFLIRQSIAIGTSIIIANGVPSITAHAAVITANPDFPLIQNPKLIINPHSVKLFGKKPF